MTNVPRQCVLILRIVCALSALGAEALSLEFHFSLTSNGDGTDHAWGGNYFVSGGSVRGGQILGVGNYSGEKGFTSQLREQAVDVQ